MTAPRVPAARIPQLELLRVIATGSIFLYHLWTVIPLSSDASVPGLVLAQVPLLGTLGVIVFNCITGFVLALPYLGHHHPRPIPGSLSFFRRRFGRLCLYYYPVLVLWTIPWLALAVQEQGWLLVLLAVAAHVVFVHTLHASTFFAIVPAFWWLGMLAQFYLVCPWLLQCFERLGAGRTCVLACVIPWAVWIVLTHLADQFPGSTLAMVHYLSYFNLPVRLPEFALGMWLASAWNRGVPLVYGHQRATAPSGIIMMLMRPLLVGVILFLLLQRTFMQHFAHPFGHIYLVFWCVCSMLAVLRWWLASQLGRLRLSADLAATSYGIYLLHQPLLDYANQWLADIFSPASRFLVLLIGIGLLCYHAAVGLNSLVERLWR